MGWKLLFGAAAAARWLFLRPRVTVVRCSTCPAERAGRRRLLRWLEAAAVGVLASLVAATTWASATERVLEVTVDRPAEDEPWRLSGRSRNLEEFDLWPMVYAPGGLTWHVQTNECRPLQLDLPAVPWWPWASQEWSLEIATPGEPAEGPEGQYVAAAFMLNQTAGPALWAECEKPETGVVTRPSDGDIQAYAEAVIVTGDSPEFGSRPAVRAARPDVGLDQSSARRRAITASS